MPISSVGSAWNPALVPLIGGGWATFQPGRSGAGASVEAGPDVAFGSGTVSGGESGDNRVINGTGFGTKPGTPYFEDFEALTPRIYTGGQSIGSMITVNGGPEVVTNKSASGSRSLRNPYNTADFPLVYLPLSGTQPRAYLCAKWRPEGFGDIHIWKMGRIGSGSPYGGIGRAGSSWGGNPISGFTGEIVNSNGITSWSEQITSEVDAVDAFQLNQWLFYECEFYAGTLNNSDCHFIERVNGRVTARWQNRPYLTSANSLLPTWFLTPTNGLDGAAGFTTWMDEVYCDESRARVVMTNSATYSSSTKFEIQPVVSWADTAIQYFPRRGSSFTAGESANLHVFNNVGTQVATINTTA